MPKQTIHILRDKSSYKSIVRESKGFFITPDNKGRIARIQDHF